MAIKSLSIRIDSEMLNKLHYIADYEEEVPQTVKYLFLFATVLKNMKKNTKK